jgi:hypothetical protein
MAVAQLCGSVNLADAETVFRTVAEISGDSVARIPDGETGDRQDWILAQVPRLAANPGLERVEDADHRYRVMPSFRLRPGVPAHDVRFDLGYAERALEAWPVFRRLRDGGVIGRDVRFQVSLPTQMEVVGPFIAHDDQPALAPVYEAALRTEIDAIVAAVPADELALQWDVAVELSWLEEATPSPPGVGEPEVVAQLVRLGGLVPEAVQLGYHFCYGDAPESPGATGRHFKQPQDMRLLVRLANGVVAGSGRTVDWVHMPVPVERDDDAYFVPLDDLELGDTRLFLGLVHWQDGVEGTQRRIDAAAEHVTGFGVATECGMGRRPRDKVPVLLAIQRDVTTPA